MSTHQDSRGNECIVIIAGTNTLVHSKIDIYSHPTDRFTFTPAQLRTWTIWRPQCVNVICGIYKKMDHLGAIFDALKLTFECINLENSLVTTCASNPRTMRANVELHHLYRDCGNFFTHFMLWWSREVVF